jgi:hypothetical protein
VPLLVVSALLASSASATEYRIGGVGVPEGEPEAFEGSLGQLELSATISSKSVVIICTSDTVKELEVEYEGKAKGVFAYAGCKLDEVVSGKDKEVSGCEVEPFNFSFASELIEAGGKAEEVFKPRTGSIMFTVKIKGCACPSMNNYAGSYEAEGEYTAIVVEGSTEASEHELESLVGGSTIKLGGKEAKFDNAPSNLQDKFDAMNWSVAPVVRNIFSLTPKPTLKFPNTKAGEVKTFLLRDAGPNEIEVLKNGLAGAGAGEYEILQPKKTAEEACIPGVPLLPPKLKNGEHCWIYLELKNLNAKLATYSIELEFIGAGGITSSYTRNVEI